MDQLAQLTRWYADQCNGEWEHAYGVRLETLDNPGWRLQVDLANTGLRDKPFVELKRGDPESADSWLHAKIEDNTFVAAGGTFNLPELLDCFLDWAMKGLA